MEKPKSILKKNATYTEAPRVTFNEDEIEEHDKQRGNKMKIDEPKTPFVFSDDERSKEVKVARKFDVEQRNKDLQREAEKEQEDIEELKRKEEKKRKFLEKRKQHYKNEVGKR